MAHPSFTTKNGKILDIGQDGKSLHGNGSADLKGIFSTPGPLHHRNKRVLFPGVHGEIILTFGVNARNIVWSGVVWGKDHSTLNLIDRDIEEMIKSADSGTMTDQQGRSIENCILQEYQRVSPREQSGNGFIQGFAILFLELTP
jgi:hypothetical protein